MQFANSLLMLYCNIMRYINTILLTLTCLFLTKVSYAEDIKIVSSIKPLHSIVSNVVGDDNSVNLLLFAIEIFILLFFMVCKGLARNVSSELSSM